MGDKQAVCAHACRLITRLAPFPLPASSRKTQEFQKGEGHSPLSIDWCMVSAFQVLKILPASYHLRLIAHL